MKKTSLLLSAFLFSGLCFAQHTNSSDNKSLLWRISNKSMNKPSYLFGTIHAICPDDYLWTDSMDACLQKTDEVCFEMDISDPQVMMQVAAYMIDASGKKLKDYFTPQQYSKLENYIKDSLGMDINMVSQMKPVALTSLFITKSTNCKAPVMYEERISEEAKKLKIPIAGLEEPQDEIDIMEKIPVDSVIKELIAMTDGKPDDLAAYAELVHAYKTQDLPTLYKLINNSKESGIDMGIFINDRNRKWIGKMTDKMDQRAVFFAVGAGHLWGEKGVINLLRKKGYTVVPVK